MRLQVSYCHPGTPGGAVKPEPPSVIPVTPLLMAPIQALHMGFIHRYAVSDEQQELFQNQRTASDQVNGVSEIVNKVYNQIDSN
jgi:hypothetical protein